MIKLLLCTELRYNPSPRGKKAKIRKEKIIIDLRFILKNEFQVYSYNLIVNTTYRIILYYTI